MCSGGRKRAAKQAAQQAADNAQLASDREAQIEANRRNAIRIGTEAEAANKATAAATAQGIENYRKQQMMMIAASKAQGSRRYGTNAASISQGILSQQEKKKRKKGLKVSPADGYREGNPGSTSASLKIGSQEASPGTGTNLPV